MSNFVQLGGAGDILPLLLAIERQKAIFGEEEEVCLYAEGEWKSEFFAFPQLRGILLDILRRVECGQLLLALLVKGNSEFSPLPDASQAMALLGLGNVICSCGDNALGLAPGHVLWCSGAQTLSLNGPESYTLVLTFSPMP